MKLTRKDHRDSDEWHDTGRRLIIKVRNLSLNENTGDAEQLLTRARLLINHSLDGEVHYLAPVGASRLLVLTDPGEVFIYYKRSDLNLYQMAADKYQSSRSVRQRALVKTPCKLVGAGRILSIISAKPV